MYKWVNLGWNMIDVRFVFSKQYAYPVTTLWRHQMETFSGLLALCVGNSPVTSEFPSQRPVARSFDVFFDLRLNKRLSTRSRHRWFETPSNSLWCHVNEICQKQTHHLSNYVLQYTTIQSIQDYHWMFLKADGLSRQLDYKHGLSKTAR